MSIQSFSDEITEKFFVTGNPGKASWAAVKSVALRKLDMVQYASRLDDLKSPPGNNLELLKGDLAGYHSIRINRQWRVVFRWTPSGPQDVRITDYH